MTTAIEHELATLLRGEIAAAETYKQALDKVDDPDAGPLRQVQNEHGDAIKFLYEQLAARGFEPPTSSGAWGFFTRTIESAASLLGDKAALTALRRGEKTGLEMYERALESGQLPESCRQHLTRTLIPAQRRHIDLLSRLMEDS